MVEHQLPKLRVASSIRHRSSNIKAYGFTGLLRIILYDAVSAKHEKPCLH